MKTKQIECLTCRRCRGTLGYPQNRRVLLSPVLKTKMWYNKISSKLNMTDAQLTIILTSIPIILTTFGTLLINVLTLLGVGRARQEAAAQAAMITDKVTSVEKNTNGINQALQAKIESVTEDKKNLERIITAQLQSPPKPFGEK